jgi:hypothetical protein
MSLLHHPNSPQVQLDAESVAESHFWAEGTVLGGSYGGTTGYIDEVGAAAGTLVLPALYTG